MHMRRVGVVLALVGGLVLFAAAGQVWAVDTDGDGVDDVMDVCSNTPAGTAVDAEGRPLGDIDKDCDTDLADYILLIQGFTGPLSPLEMVMVPGGTFKYQNGEFIDIGAFMIDRYEVTNTEYCQFLNAADPTSQYWSVAMEAEILRAGSSDNYHYTVQPDREDYPVRWVSALDAEAYAVWRGSVDGVTYSLPTEQQWEKAAGWNPALQKLWTYAFQRDLIDCDWCVYNAMTCGNTGPRVVGYFDGGDDRNNAKSYYGCYDMSGNLYEWTSSMYDSILRVFRGGSWGCAPTHCQTTYRNGTTPSGRYDGLGFRLVLELE